MLKDRLKKYSQKVWLLLLMLHDALHLHHPACTLLGHLGLPMAMHSQHREYVWSVSYCACSEHVAPRQNTSVAVNAPATSIL